METIGYHQPTTIDEATALHGSSADPRYIAGGQSLIPMMRLGLDRPAVLIDIAAIPGLAGVTSDDNTLVVGAMTRHADIADSTLVAERTPAIARLAAAIGDPAVRNRGTIGGAVALHDPAGDWPAALLALAATVVTDRRHIVADTFFTDLFETALAPGEIITAIHLPVPLRAGYARFRGQASRFPLAAVFAAETADGPRLAATGAGSGAFRLTAWEDRLAGMFRADRLERLAWPADELADTMHGSADYRGHLLGVMARRAVAAATA